MLFILSLGGLQPGDARRGNLGVIGMVIAILATAIGNVLSGMPPPGGHRRHGRRGRAVGAVAKAAMTAMPQLVALLHSFVGLGGAGGHVEPVGGHEAATTGETVVHLIEIWLGVAIGAIIFTGSVIAWAKLKGSLSGKPLLLPGRHLLNPWCC